METTDELQILIDQARQNLSKESREAIDAVNWKLTILEMGKKYNEEQLENLETETELLLCGILSPAEYQKELENRMLISKEEVESLLSEMDKLIFKKIQQELEKRISTKETVAPLVITPKIPTIDSRFTNMPKETQDAISKSDYQKNLYIIGEKYKLNIEQMGILEEVTIKVMQNVVHSDQYEGELSSRITISKEDISNLVKDVNENVFKKVREFMKIQDGVIDNKEDEVPLPPYAKVEIKTIEIPKIIETPKPIQEITNIPKNILEEKLSGPTSSNNTISDYSSPKINTLPPSLNNLDSSPKSHDPYREAF